MSRPRIIVVGSGIAGITAALRSAAHGTHVTLVTKGSLEESNTRHAQGGIAGAVFPDDRAVDHAHDTMVAGAWLGDRKAVDVLVTEGPARIHELAALGVAFDREADGSWVRGLEAAHSYPRILHAGGDATGAAIEIALAAALRRSDIDVLEHALLTELLTVDGRVTGIELLRDGRVELLEADAVILATGGAGRLYAHSTNPPIATGDGIAVALRAGAAVADLEFVQFHPTVLAGEPFLVSEAVRGEGATLIDEDGRRFAFDDHPEGELAPRDVLARSIAAHMAAQDGRPVRLDATALGRDFLARRFPTIDAAVRARGLDWSAEPIPVTPAAHYLMGGIVTDLDGRTSLPGLYAAGEVARTGVHGANRLASNSLLEGAVFGARAGEAAARDASRPSGVLARRPVPQAASSAPPWLRRTRGYSPDEGGSRTTALAPRIPPRPAATPFSRAALQDLMWRDAGLRRDATGLRRAAEQLAAWRSAAADGPAPSTVAEHEDANLLTVASAIVDAAAARTESVGAHFREDAVDRPTHPVEPLELVG